MKGGGVQIQRVGADAVCCVKRILVFVLLLWVSAMVMGKSENSAFAQKAPGAVKSPVQKEAGGDAKKPLPLPPQEVVAGSAWSEVSLLASGGYFFPGKDQSDMLAPSWTVKLIVQKNNIAETLFGGGIDISYAKLKDKEVKDGSMTYVTLLPNATATFSLFGIVNAQLKAGPGLSTIYSKVNDKSDFSLSFTLGGSAGLFRIFGRHFVLGFEGAFWYYFQMHAASAMAVYGYTGYYF